MSQFYPSTELDSGWLAVSLNAPWSALGSPNRGAVALVRNGVGYISLTASNSSAVAANAVIGVLPAECRPAAVVHTVFRSSGLVPIVIYPSGDVQTTVAIGSGVGVYGSTVFPLG